MELSDSTVNVMTQEVMRIAKVARQVLASEFPALLNSCQRAAIILHSLFEELEDIEVDIINGDVLGDNDEPGKPHMWVVMHDDWGLDWPNRGEKYLLDITLSQFGDYPEIVFLPLKEAINKYRYKEYWVFELDRSHVRAQFERLEACKKILNNQ